MSQSKVFHGLLHRVGDSHFYQLILIILCTTIGLQAGSTSLVNAFLFYQDDYVCPPSINNCQEYVCSLPTHERTVFVNSDFSSLLSRFGDYRCVVGGEVDAVQVFIYSGGFVGVISSAVILTYFTQKKVLIGTLFFNIAGFLITLVSPSLWVAGWGLFLNFMGRSVQTDLITTYISDSTAETIRVKYLLWVEVGFALGASLVAIAYWMLHPW